MASTEAEGRVVLAVGLWGGARVALPDVWGGESCFLTVRRLAGSELDWIGVTLGGLPGARRAGLESGARGT